MPDLEDIARDGTENARWLLAASILAPAPAVTAVLDILTPTDVELLDPPTGILLGLAADLARQGIDPTAPLIGGEALRQGLYSGHHGDLARTRLADAVTTNAAPAALPRYAADCAALLFRTRMAATGHAITEHALNGSEADAWTGFCRDGAALRRLHGILLQLRRHAGQEHAA